MAAANVTMSAWFPAVVALGGSSLLVCCHLFFICLCICYCSWCVCCPCNRRRGRAQLVVMRKEGEKKNEVRFHTSTGVTMFVPPRLMDHPSSSTLSPVTPPTPNSSTSYNSTCDSYSHLFSSSAHSVDNTGPPFPRVDNTGPPSPRVDNTGPPSPTDSCSYVLPNNMTKVNDGTERSTSWQKFGRSTAMPIYILSRSQAEDTLQAQGTVGCYLFRKTSDNKVCLSALAEKDCNLVCRHLLLIENAEGKVKIDSLPNGSDCFSSLKELEEYYWGNDIHFQDGGASLNLSVPLHF